MIGPNIIIFTQQLKEFKLSNHKYDYHTAVVLTISFIAKHRKPINLSCHIPLNVFLLGSSKHKSSF